MHLVTWVLLVLDRYCTNFNEMKTPAQVVMVYLAETMVGS